MLLHWKNTFDGKKQHLEVLSKKPWGLEDLFHYGFDQ